MKYIRTKDGRILIAPNLYDNGGLVLCSEPPMYETRNAKIEWGCVFCHDVIKQADTIEELCDFIFYRNFDDILVIREMPVNIKSIYRDIGLGLIKKDVKLAILTDEGLIYVAKMNDKGELELL